MINYFSVASQKDANLKNTQQYGRFDMIDTVGSDDIEIDAAGEQ